jgi:hypothetical protein
MKKSDLKKLLTSLAVMSIILLAGCKNTPKEIHAKDFHEGLAAFEKDGKWGYVDTLENVVIPYLYDSVAHFNGGVAVVTLDKKIGTIDKTGNTVIAVKYDSIGSFTDSMAIVGDNGKYGFVDITGKEVIPLLYENVEPFVDGWATVVQNIDTFKIDKNGEKNILIGTWRVSSFAFKTDPNKVQGIDVSFAPASENKAEIMILGENGVFQCDIDMSDGNVLRGGKAMALAKNNKWQSSGQKVKDGNYSCNIELLPASKGLTYKINIKGKDILTLEVFEVINKSEKPDPNTGYIIKGGKVPMHHTLTFKRQK